LAPGDTNAVKHLRRQFLRLAAGAAALPVISRFARAQTYPARPVRIIVPVPPGGALDIVARLMGQWLSDRLAQPFIIENRPGAGTNIGVEAGVHAPADGYTLLLIPPSVTVNATLYKLNFNFIRDMVPVAMISRLPLVMEVNLSVPATTVPEFISYAKANPGKVNMASGGSGSPSHIVGELFKMMTGVNMVHVPYHGGAPALIDLIGGQVQVMFSPLPESIATIKAGKVRALAVTPRSVRRRCRTCRPWASFCRASRPAPGKASAHPKTRPLKSSASSIARSMPRSPTPKSRRVLQTLAVRRRRCRPPTSRRSWSRKPPSGPR
jgi:tripartite-type tricarboxylate transporter receptor subunit TctC